MAKTLLHLPFEPGLTDSADPVVIGGRLYQAENIRFPKQGRVSKRFGLTVPTFAGATGTPNAIGEFQGTPWIMGDCVLTVSGGTGAAAMTATIPNRASRVLPRRADPIFYEEASSALVSGSGQPVSHKPVSGCDAVIHGGNILITWDDQVAWGYSVRTPEGAILKQQRLYGGFIHRTLETGSTYSLVVSPSEFAGASLVAYQISKTTHEILSNPSSVGTLFAGGSSAYDAYMYDIANVVWYAVWQNSATDLTIARFSGTTQTHSTSFSIGGIASSVSIVVGSFGVGIAYIDASSDVYVASSTATLSAVSGPNILLNNANGGEWGGQIGLCVYSATQAFCAASGIDTAAGNNSRIMRAGFLDINGGVSIGAAGGFLQNYHFSLASQPFLLGNRICVWCCTDNDLPAAANGALPDALEVGGWTNQRTYWLMDFTDSRDTVSDFSIHRIPLTVMTTAPMIGFVDNKTTSRMILPKASNLGRFWFCPLLEVIKQRKTLTSTGFDGDTTQVRLISWFDQDQDTLYARRTHSEANGAEHFAGGFISEYMGGLFESGFVHYPVIVEARRMTGAGSVGGWATGTNFSYTAVYEWTDAKGRRHRSQPADPVVPGVPSYVGIGSNDKVQLFVTTLAAGKGAVPTGMNLGGVKVQLYRTTHNGTIYYRDTDNVSDKVSAQPTPSGPTISITDVTSDSNLSTREVLYTQGGVLGNLVPPAARYITQGGGRVWLGGLLESRRVHFSKLIVQSEPVQFPDDDSFRIEMPEDVTGIVWGDGSLVVFSERAIYLVSGDGPNDQGQGSFATPQRLPSDVGCVEHHSIVETQNGWMFQSRRGIYLLPRGFGPPQFVGAEIQDTMLSYPTVRSAAVINNPGGSRNGETTVRYVVANAAGETRVPVWDTALNRWVSVDKYESNDLALIGQQKDACVVVRDSLSDSQPVRRELAGVWGDGSVGTGFVSSRIRTGNLRPFGQLGWGRVSTLEVMGEVREPATLNVRVSYDGATGVLLPDVKKNGSVGQRFHQQYALAQTECNSIDVELWDGASGASEGLVFHGITLEVDPIEGPSRRGADERS